LHGIAKLRGGVGPIEGMAKVQGSDGQRHDVKLQPGSLLVIEQGERHEIRNDGSALLRTVNFYYPPAFDAEGEPVGPGKG
jgi:mannose-6-phosphate isomerase-like protein (cupin superfamily)